MKLKKIILFLTLLTLTAIIVAGSIYYFSKQNNAVKMVHERAENSVKMLAGNLDLIVNDHLRILRSIAGIWEIKKAVESSEKELLRFANDALKHFQMTLNADVIYLMDRNGVVRISSNHDSSDSFVGMDFEFRPYFKKAIGGDSYAYPALGIATHKRGLYLSCPVFPDENGVPGGVLVMKDFPEDLQAELDLDNSDRWLLADPEGIIFMSSFGKMDFKSLQPLTEDEKESVVAGRQFGKGPWEWSGLTFTNNNSLFQRAEDPAGRRYMVHQYGLKSIAGWKLYYLHDLEDVHEQVVTPLFRSTGLVVILLCLLSTLISTLFYFLAGREIKARQKIENDLKFNEERWRSFFQTAGSIILVLSPNNRVVEINPAGEKFYGVSREQMIGMDYIENFLPEGDRIPVAEAITGILQGGRLENFENRVLAADNEERIVLWNANRLGDEKDGVQGVIAFGQDINERKKAEFEMDNLFRMVEKAKKEWEGSLDCIDDMIVIVSPDGIIKRMNMPFREFISASYTELIGKDWKEVFRDFGLIGGVELRTGEPRKIWHEATSSWLIISRFELENDASDVSPGSVITVCNETELYQTLEELDRKNAEIEMNRRKLQQALDELSSIIQRVAEEEDFGVRYENPGIQKCWEILQCEKEDCPCHGQEPMRCWQIAGTYCGGEMQCDFAEKLESCVACPVYESATRDPIFLIGEEFNNMMHILEYKNDELQNAYEDLKQAHYQILQQEKMASVGQLAAGVAHEINNPMGFIGSNLASLGKYCGKLTEFIELQKKILARVDDPDVIAELNDAREKLKLDFIIEDLQDLISESLDGVDRVKQIVMGLKNFSRVDLDAPQMADINECLESSLAVVWNEIKYKATVEKKYGDVPRIMCFPQQLNQVFVNLMVNGAQAIEEEGVISLETKRIDGFVHVSVSDTGIGIPPENLERVFEPFFTTKDVGKGTGLGMSIAYDIIKKHGGEIVIDSVVGKGSTFTVRLPVDSCFGSSGET